VRTNSTHQDTSVCAALIDFLERHRVLNMECGAHKLRTPRHLGVCSPHRFLERHGVANMECGAYYLCPPRYLGVCGIPKFVR